MNAPLSLFDPAPDIQAPAPSVPSATSEAAADAIRHSPFRRTSLRRIMLFLFDVPASETRSMAEIGAAVDIPVHVMCARLKDVDYLVECVPGDRASSAKPSLRVNGYRLNPAGRERTRQAKSEPFPPPTAA